MKISEQARRYELEHGLTLKGVLFHGDEKFEFKYGYENINKSKTTVIHGYTGAQNVVEIVTVRPISLAIGDKIQLVDGKKGKTVSLSVALLDDVQLRFVSYERADKVTRITIQFV